MRCFARWSCGTAFSLSFSLSNRVFCPLMRSLMVIFSTALSSSANYCQIAPQDTQAAADKAAKKAEEKKQAQKQAQMPDAAAAPADLAKAVQNPVASLISVPIQNLVEYNIGPYARNRDTVIQFQPVIPAQISENWNMITRVIGAFVYQPDVSPADPINSQRHQGTFGFADLNPSLFFSPVHSGKIIWGAGPVFVIPTATDDVLGTGKFSMGPGIVALT
jgi:hypothetical protein